MPLSAKVSPEVSRRAMDLPMCEPCGNFPLRVTDKHGRVYVECPNCGARTHRSSDPKVAPRQWRVLVVILNEPKD